jgi:hypothetical protein
LSIARPPPRKNELVRPRLKVPPSDGWKRTPWAAIHDSMGFDSAIINRASPSSVAKSVCTNFTPASPSIGSTSTATMVAVGPSRSRSTCDQLPGAAPRSTAWRPGRNSLSFSASSISLNAARER